MVRGRHSVDEKNRTENGAAVDPIHQIQQPLLGATKPETHDQLRMLETSAEVGATIRSMSARRKA